MNLIVRPGILTFQQELQHKDPEVLLLGCKDLTVPLDIWSTTMALLGTQLLVPTRLSIYLLLAVAVAVLGELLLLGGQVAAAVLVVLLILHKLLRLQMRLLL
jgi:hypothetical protein